MTSGLITRARVDQIRAELDASGEEWAAAAQAMPEVVVTSGADHRYRDLVVLGEHVQHSAEQPNWTYPVTLYRAGEQWWATGWSDVSKGRIHQPLGMVYDEDAGVHRAGADDEQ